VPRANDNDGVERGFYVYVHKDKSNDVPFYVGKGRGKRAYSESRRTRAWSEKVAGLQNGYEVGIVAEDLSEEEAFDLEGDLIGKYGRLINNTGPLVNKTEGGSLDGEIIASISFALPRTQEEQREADREATPLKQHTWEIRKQLGASITTQFQSFQRSYDALVGEFVEEAEDEETDLEGAIDDVIQVALSSAKHLAKRQLSLNDFYRDIEEEREYLESMLEDYDPEVDKAEIASLAKEVEGYLRERLANLRE